VVTEPPLTSDKPVDELIENISETPNFAQYPCHNQAVERCIKVVTDASLKVCGQEARDGYIRAKLEARKKLPIFDNKAQYYSSRK
jgi:hypothetical protein